MYYWIHKINVSRDIPDSCLSCTFHTQFYFTGKRKRKCTKNFSKTCHWKLSLLLLLFEVIAREHVGTQGTSKNVRKHENTQDTLPREHVNTQGTWTRKHERHVGTWAQSNDNDYLNNNSWILIHFELFINCSILLGKCASHQRCQYK